MVNPVAKTSIVVGARFITRGAQLISFALLARMLSVRGFGDYGVLTSAVFLGALIGNLGLRQAGAHALGQERMSAGEVTSSVLLMWPILSAGCCATLWWFAKDQFSSLSHVEIVSIYFSVFAIMCLTLLQAVFLGRGEAGTFSLLETGPRVAQALMIVMLWITDRLTFAAALISFAAGFAMFVPMAVYRSYKNGGAIRPRLAALPGLLRFGFLFALSLFIITMQGRVGMFFLHGRDGAEAAGQFFAAQRASEIFLDVATGAALILFSETARSTDPRATLQSSMRVAVGLFITFAVLGCVAAVFSPFAISLLLGGGYASAKPALVVLCLGLGFAAATRIMNGVVSGLGRPWLSGVIATIGLAVNIAVCSVAIPKMGASGASLGLVAGNIICCFGYVIACRVFFEVGVSDALPDLHKITITLVDRLRRRRVRR